MKNTKKFWIYVIFPDDPEFKFFRKSRFTTLQYYAQSAEEAIEKAKAKMKLGCTECGYWGGFAASQIQKMEFVAHEKKMA